MEVGVYFQVKCVKQSDANCIYRVTVLEFMAVNHGCTVRHYASNFLISNETIRYLRYSLPPTMSGFLVWHPYTIWHRLINRCIVSIEISCGRTQLYIHKYMYYEITTTPDTNRICRCVYCHMVTMKLIGPCQVFATVKSLQLLAIGPRPSPW